MSDILKLIKSEIEYNNEIRDIHQDGVLTMFEIYIHAHEKMTIDQFYDFCERWYPDYKPKKK